MRNVSKYKNMSRSGCTWFVNNSMADDWSKDLCLDTARCWEKKVTKNIVIVNSTNFK